LVNKKGGGVLAIQGGDELWWDHPNDNAADVSVIRIDETSEMDVSHIGSSDLATLEMLRKHDFGIGDDVFVIGLFSFAPGEKQNMPIVRHGNIAMLPNEQLQTELGFTDAYLIEARSIGGLSGSPVFVRKTVMIRTRRVDGEEIEQFDSFLSGAGGSLCLGLAQGHWDVKESKINSPGVMHDQHGVNMGIAIVVPAFKILETLNRTELVNDRADRDAKFVAERLPRMD